MLRIKKPYRLKVIWKSWFFAWRRYNRSHCKSNIYNKKAKEFDQSLYFKIVYYIKTVDKISCDPLWITLPDMGFSVHMIDLAQKTSLTSLKKTAILHWNWPSGLQCGTDMVAYFHHIHWIYADKTREALHGFKKLGTGGRHINNLNYAADVVLRSTSNEDLRDLAD